MASGLAAAAGCDRGGAAPAERESPAALAHEAPAAAEAPAATAALAAAPAPAPAAVADEPDDDDKPATPRAAAMDDDDDDEQPRPTKHKKRPGGGDKEQAPVGLRVKRLQFSGAISGREPSDARQIFTPAEDVYAFVEVGNTLGEATRISITFISPKKTASKISLAVGDSARWRTWAKRRLTKDAGTWQVIVRDDAGHQLASGSFEVAP
jgi:hypothetical protein